MKKILLSVYCLIFALCAFGQREKDLELHIETDSFVVSFDFVLYDLVLTSAVEERFAREAPPLEARLEALCEHRPSVGMSNLNDGALTLNDSISNLAERFWDDIEEVNQRYENLIKECAVSEKVLQFNIHYITTTRRYLGEKTATWHIDTITCVFPQPESDSPFEFVFEIDSVVKTPYGRFTNEASVYFRLYRQGFTQPKNTLYRVKDGKKNHVLWHRWDTCGWPGRLTIDCARDATRLERSIETCSAFSSALGLKPESSYRSLYQDFPNILYKRVNPLHEFLASGYWWHQDTHRAPILYTNRGLAHHTRARYNQRKKYR